MEISLLLTLFVFGSIMIVMTPLGGGYDEDHHLYRVWQLSARELLPREMSARQANFPEIYFDLSYRKQPLVGSVGFDYWKQYGGIKLYDRGYHYGPLDTRSRYSPPLLMPQAVAMYIGKRWDWPALLTYYATRFAGLFIYSVLAWLAFRFVPFGKWTLFALLVAPMAIYQASTVNADTITNGIGFLFISGTLYLARKDEIRNRDFGTLILLLALLFLTKPNIFPLVVLPFVLIPPARFANKFGYPLLILAAFVLFGVEFIGWNLLSPNRGFLPSGNVNAVEQLKYILSHPLAFPGVILSDLPAAGPKYLQQWIGVYGYDYGTVPILTYVFFAIGLLASLLIPADEQKPDTRTRIALLTLFGVCYLFTALSLYITYTAVGEKFVYGVQGRYFIPIFPLLFLALYKLPVFQKFHSRAWVTGLFSLAALGAFTAGLILTYHVDCGASYYTSGLCYQPFYKNFSPLTRSSPPVSNSMTLVQEIVPICNGMTRVQVRVNSAGEVKDGSVEFTLQDVKSDSNIVQQTAENDSLPSDAWYSIDFPPEWTSAGKVYSLTIRGINNQTGNGPLLAYSIKPEYPLGTLLENGILLDDDVVFRYGCVTGLQKILWTVQGDP